MAGIYWEQGNLEQARATIQQTYRLYQVLGDRLGIAYSVGRLAIIHREMGDFDKALEDNREAMGIFRELGYQEGQAHFLGNRGNIFRAKGDLDQALACFQEALHIDESMGHKGDVARHLASIAAILSLKGRSEEALALYDRALPPLRAVGSGFFLLDPLLSQAKTLHDRQEFLAARAVSEEAQQLAQQLGRKQYIVESQVLGAQITASLGDREGAWRRLETLLAASTDTLEQAALHSGLWRIWPDADHARAAVALYRHLYAEKPEYEYKMRLEELLAVGPEMENEMI